MATTYITDIGNTNCTMSYTAAGGTWLMQTRCNRLGHSFSMVATESQARSTRGYYPQQRATGVFMVGLELNGYQEFEPVMSFMAGYVRAALRNTTGIPLMSVSIPSYDFWRIGIPTGGVSFGDHVGSNVFTPSLEFESVTDPLDPRLAVGFDPNLISVFDENRPTDPTLGISPDDATRFFYPATASTNDPNARGEPLYDAPPTPYKPPKVGDPLLPG